ncbi:MAG: hypothetical protein JW837_13975 [Sedimentisphaerales bacterium]|nr:hypothetical protein [Sedimentisphaerales bacterium]
MSENIEEKLDALVARVTKVRRWLVALAVLRIAALGLVFISVYIGVYAWLDHRWNFNEIGRVIAFVLLLAGLIFLLARLRKYLLVHISCSGAANYIENIQSFDQQLVTAIEYYENKQNYPYSRVLTEQLIFDVYRDSETFDFNSIVEKRKGYALSVVILFGLVAIGFYARDNYVYFSSYFARLVRPLASVEPLSGTSLEPITEDIVTEPDSEVTFQAEVRGRMPEFGKLLLVKLEPQADNSELQTQGEEIQVRPDFDQEKKPRLKASKSFSQTGQYKYRFETGSTSTDWNKLTVCEPLKIQSMMAEVVLPKRPPRRKWVRPYTEQIENDSLEVIQQSDITLNVQTNDEIKEVVITGLDEKQITKQFNEAREFSYSFNADKSGSIKFSLVNEYGLVNSDVPDLDVRVKVDEPPGFKLISPDGDYLATDVASVPVTFEVTDDFGLDSVKMFMEIPGRQPDELDIPIEEGTRSKIFTHEIELERYNLNVGDSVLFYAQATDIDTGSAVEKRTSKSDVYFIEIRPYRQNWRPKPGGNGPPSQGAGSPPVELLNILEYTRAILKKTWDIAGKSYLSEQYRSRLGFINDDVQYCAEQLALIRDDSEYGFNQIQKAILNTVLGYYQQAGGYLAGHNAASAITPEKNAYRVLRKFILEMDLELNSPESGQGQQPDEPDSIKLQEMQEFSHEDKERIQDELKKLQQKLKKLTREQKSLKTSFENYFEQQSRDKKKSQSKNDSESKDSDDKKQSQTKGPNKQSSEDRNNQKNKSSSGSSGAKSQSTSESQSTGQSEADADSSESADKKDFAEDRDASKSEENESSSGDPGDKRNTSGIQSDSESQSSQKGKTVSDGRNPGDSKSNGQKQGDSQNQSSDNIGSASTEARLRMLQAQQRALQEQVSRLKNDLQKLPKGSENSQNKGRNEAQKHLDEALTKMDEFQDRLNEARYKSGIGNEESREAVELVKLAQRRMDLAEESLDSEIMLSDEEEFAQKAQEIAEQLSNDADALDKSVTPLQREEMLARLEAAKRLLERMPEPQWATIKNKPNKGTSSTGQVFTKNPNMSSAEAARQVARQFWSVAVNVKKYRRQLIEDEPSDVKFFGQENEFFENAAKFDRESVKK